MINLIKENIKSKIKTRRVLRNNLYKQDELLLTLAEAITELRSVVDEIKETNFKDIYYEEHKRYKDLDKEVKRLRKRVKEYEKRNSTNNS